MNWKQSVFTSIAIFITGFVFVGLGGDTNNWQVNLGTALILLSFVSAPIFRYLPAYIKKVGSTLISGKWKKEHKELSEKITEQANKPGTPEKKIKRSENIKIKCPFCKEIIPSNALRCSHCTADLSGKEPQRDIENQLRRNQKATNIFAIIIISIFVLTLIYMGLYTDLTDPKPQSNLVVGQSGFLRSGNVETLFVAVDQESFKELVKAVKAGDTVGILELAAQRRVFGVTSGTSVLILEQNFSQYRIRVLGGVQDVDINKVGRAGWVPREWVVTQ